jgi:hypothetical protein
MFKSKTSRLALMAVAFMLPVVLGERVPAAPEHASTEAAPADSVRTAPAPEVEVARATTTPARMFAYA